MVKETRLVVYVIRILLHSMKPTELQKMAETIQLPALENKCWNYSFPFIGHGMNQTYTV
jgi:hypothetical protein